MKKFILCTAFIFLFVLAAGCQKKDIKLTAEDLNTNTLLVKNDGTVQAATVESFDKDYYSEEELKSFISDQIEAFNQETGQEAITMDSLTVKDATAVLILNYAGLDNYNAFNEVESTLMTAAEAKSGAVTLPDVLVSAEDGAYANPDAILDNEKYEVLVVHENTDVYVDGSIKYYSSGVLEGKSKLRTESEDETVIIYKP